MCVCVCANKKYENEIKTFIKTALRVGVESEMQPDVINFQFVYSCCPSLALSLILCLFNHRPLLIRILIVRYAIFRTKKKREQATKERETEGNSIRRYGNKNIFSAECRLMTMVLCVCVSESYLLNTRAIKSRIFTSLKKKL